MRPPVSMTIVSLALLGILSPAAGQAQQICADVESAKLALAAKPATRNPMATRTQDVQAPRQQGDMQAPRSQDIQAPRNQDIQAPRSQDIQAPRSDQSTPGAGTAPHHAQAARLVKEAEAACSSGDTAVASAKAREAMSLLDR
ncbi:MAG TPA: hypothetical protein VF653_11820 [Methylomirabilota bacterium]